MENGQFNESALAYKCFHLKGVHQQALSPCRRFLSEEAVLLSDPSAVRMHVRWIIWILVLLQTAFRVQLSLHSSMSSLSVSVEGSCTLCIVLPAQVLIMFKGFPPQARTHRTLLLTRFASQTSVCCFLA